MNYCTLPRKCHSLSINDEKVKLGLKLLSHLWFPSGEFIIGRVIKAMNNSWHPDCFCCDICQAVLADVGFVKNAGRYVSYLIPFFI